MSWTQASAGLTMLMIVGATSLTAQEDRGVLVERARAEFDEQAALDLLIRAADPGAAPLDSLWAVSVHDLALMLMGMGEEELASTWLRWSVRHGSQWPVDAASGWYPEQLLRAYDDAVTAVDPAEPDDGPLQTSWIWPEEWDPDASGTLRIDPASTPPGVTVSVDGNEVLQPGGEMSLEPGSHELVIASNAGELLREQREVLPAATTVLSVQAAPALADAAEVRVRDVLVQIRFQDGGTSVCTNGVVVRPDGTVLTSWSGIGQRSEVTVATAAGASTTASVAGRDSDLDLAVLRLNRPTSPVLDASGGAPGQRAWSVYRDGCETAGSAATTLETWPGPESGAGTVASALPVSGQGAPLVDADGNLLGIVIDPTRVIPMARAEDLLQRISAEGVVATGMEGAQVDRAGGGFPYVWVGAGVAAAGVAALLMGGGGGDGNGNGDDTGILIRFIP